MRVKRIAGRRVLLYLGLAVVAVPNFLAISLTLPALFSADLTGADWHLLTTAADLAGTDALYRFEGGAFHHSPLVAYAFGAISLLGLPIWRLLHVVVLALLPTWRLAGLTLIFFPFWADLFSGNVLTFALVAAALAISGSSIGAGAYLGLVALMPQPILIPAAAWLLWQRPGWRWPFVGFLVAHVVGAALTGQGDEWLLAMWRSVVEVDLAAGIGPARVIGWIWIPVGVAVAAWCTVRGKLGLASIYAAPTWLHYDPLMLLLQLVPRAPVIPVRSPHELVTTAPVEVATVPIKVEP